MANRFKAPLRDSIKPGLMFDTPYERGCTVVTAIDPVTLDFVGTGPDGIECLYGMAMVECLYPAETR